MHAVTEWVKLSAFSSIYLSDDISGERNINLEMFDSPHKEKKISTLFIGPYFIVSYFVRFTLISV